MTEAASAPIELFTSVLGLLVVVLFFLFRKNEERQALLILAVAAYVVKAALVPAYHWMLVETGWGGFAYLDSRGYHDNAGEMAYELARGLPHNSQGWTYRDPGYNYVCAFLYMVFGSSTLIARWFNVMLSCFTLLYVYRIAVIAFDRDVARIAVRLAAFMPFSAMLTINHRKEGLVIFLATILFHRALIIVSQQKNWLASVPWLLFWLVPMYFVRSGFVPVFLAMLLIMFFLTQRSLAVGVALSTLVLIAVIAVQFVLPESLDRLSVEQNLAELEVRLEDTAHEVRTTGGLLRFVKVTSPFDLWKAPFATFLLLLLPFPPNVGQDQPVYAQMTGFAQLIFLIFLPQLFLGVREVFRAGVWRKRLPLLIYTSGFLLFIGAFSVGVLRYRETVFPVVMVLVGAGLRAKQYLIWSGAVYTGLVTLAAFIYLSRFIL